MTVSPFLVLQARAEARAILYHAHQLDLDEAMLPLRAYARASGILDDIGAAAVLAILDRAFGIEPDNNEAGDGG